MFYAEVTFSTGRTPLSNGINLDSLNPSQREAVLHCEGPTLVLAGAGSGKTRVLTHKIAYLVSLGMKPWEILAVTFTNKAAREMVSRVEKLLSIPAQGLWIGTFHGICVRILRREADRWGFRRDFTIYDRDDQLSMVKRALADLHIKKDSLSATRSLGIIGKAKNDGLDPEEFRQFVAERDAADAAKIFVKYNELLRTAGAFDFDDLLLKPVEMFRKDPESLRDWQSRFRHILVDEYQDTNNTQYLLMHLLAAGHGNVTVVGDDDQSIYSWRGANIQNILNFETDFRGVKTVRLEDNYRSTSFILRAANEVVKHNKGRMSKELRTSRQGGVKVRLIEAWDDRDEAGRVVSSLMKERDEYTLRLRDFVILYRTNAQSRSFEDVLRRNRLPYIIVGGIKFYERKEIKDVLAYLRLLANPGDTVSFARAISTPKRGVGPKTLETIEHFAAQRNISILEAVRNAGEFLSGAMLQKVREFSGVMDSLAVLRGTAGLDQLAQTVVEKIGYLSYLQIEHPEDMDDRRNNLNELITALGEFENDGSEDDLSAFLGEVTLVSDVDALNGETDAVTMMSLHSAKGLEFHSVYLAGVEDGLFPLPRSFDDEAELEEERRLFYVGITRAEDLLHISYARQRLRYGSFGGGASVFVHELPPDVLEYDRPEATVVEPPFRHGRPRVRKTMEFEDYTQEAPPSDDESGFAVGEYVRSPKFGRGRITRITGTGESAVLTIMFGVEEKKIVAKFGKLTRG